MRGIVESGEVKILKINTNDNPTDVCTKVIPTNKFKSCKEHVSGQLQAALRARLEGLLSWKTWFTGKVENCNVSAIQVAMSDMAANSQLVGWMGS